MTVHTKQFSYTTDTQFQTDLQTWLDTVRHNAGKDPVIVRDLRIVLLTTNVLLATAIAQNV